MSALASTAHSGTSVKIIGLTKLTKHGHVPSPVAPGFVAPLVSPNLSFRPITLAAAIARTATTWEDAPATLLSGLQQSALIELETLLQDGPTFALESYFKFLADTAGSQFAAKVGAGIAHLYMDALGYAWRANATSLSSLLDPHADFVYDGGNASGHGVVLAEAHGSFAKNTTAGKMVNAAKQKYFRQVKPYVAGPSKFGQVIHGYSIAFGSNPNSAGGFFAVSETRISKPRKKATPLGLSQQVDPPEGTSSPMALATHRSNFLLMGVYEVADWIDWFRLPEAEMPERRTVRFLRLQYAGRGYLVGQPLFLEPSISPWWIEDYIGLPEWRRVVRRAHFSLSSHPRMGLDSFAVEETAGTRFLNSLSNAIRGGERRMPPTMRLPTFEPTGFDLTSSDRDFKREADDVYDYALFRDGLALIGDPFRGKPRGIAEWSPEDGVVLD